MIKFTCFSILDSNFDLVRNFSSFDEAKKYFDEHELFKGVYAIFGDFAVNLYGSDF